MELVLQVKLYLLLVWKCFWQRADVHLVLGRNRREARYQPKEVTQNVETCRMGWSLWGRHGGEKAFWHIHWPNSNTEEKSGNLWIWFLPCRKLSKTSSNLPTDMHWGWKTFISFVFINISWDWQTVRKVFKHWQNFMFSYKIIGIQKCINWTYHTTLEVLNFSLAALLVNHQAKVAYIAKWTLAKRLISDPNFLQIIIGHGD